MIFQDVLVALGFVRGDGSGIQQDGSYRSNGDISAVAGNLQASTLGKGLRVKEGANAKQGVTAAMVGGTLLVANTSITANSRLMLTRQAGGANPGAVYESARVAGASFTVTSTNVADTGTVAFEIFEPA